MTIANGLRLGQYEVVAPIGAGGMGEVWLAETSEIDAITLVLNWQQRLEHR